MKQIWMYHIRSANDGSRTFMCTYTVCFPNTLNGITMTPTRIYSNLGIGSLPDDTKPLKKYQLFIGEVLLNTVENNFAVGTHATI